MDAESATEDGLDGMEAEIASGGGSAPGSVVVMLRFQATLRSDTRRVAAAA
jgi:hypothetical protein